MHGILLLDKPSGGSSNHTLQRAKRLFDAKKAGHTGSLDPLATGMLPVCFGEATKLSGYLLDADKGYETTFELGVTTNSADADGEVLQTRPLPADLSLERLIEVCQRFKGQQLQIPPMVSAIKIDGQRLYKLARKGIEVDRPPRSVFISELEVESLTGTSGTLKVRCSKGTYIRSLVTDIGEALGCGAHVTRLRRTFVSPFEQQSMITLETLEQMQADFPEDWRRLDELLLPVDAGLGHLVAVGLNSAGSATFCRGQATGCFAKPSHPVRPASAQGRTAGSPANSQAALCRVYDESERLIGLGELTECGEHVAPRRVLQWG